MITEKDLHEAIAECQGTRSPNANTCIKLASYYTILDHIKDELVTKASEIPLETYSFATPAYDSGTEFSEVIKSKDSVRVLEVVDELMSTLHIVNPKLYASVIRKLEGI